MAPIINTSDKALKILDAAEIDYELVETPKIKETPRPTTINYQINPSDFILLEGKNSGKDSYRDLLVCKYRLRADNAVESVGKELGITIKNTAKEKNKRDYIGNINREQALKLNLLLGGKTLNTRQGKDFLTLLLSGKAFDGNGEKISKSELSQIAEEIIGIRTPYRAEWFEDYFTSQQDNLILNKNYVLEENVLVPKYSNNLTTCLMKDILPGIELKKWLKDSTAQGFPKKNIKSGKLFYCHPRANRAVWFYAGSGYAFLVCGWDPQGSFARLGVRYVREAHALKN